MATTFSYVAGGEIKIDGTASVNKVKSFVAGGEVKIDGHGLCRVVKQYPVGVFTTANKIRIRPFGAVRP